MSISEPLDPRETDTADPVPPAALPGVTLEDVQANEELSLYIASADRVMEAMGYTEHGFRHANLVAKIAYQVLARLEFSDRDATSRAWPATCTTWATPWHAMRTARRARSSRIKHSATRFPRPT